MDVKLFLEGQTRWEADSPHCLMMLHEMFQHATADQGWKEAEHVQSAEAIDMNCQSWTHRQTYLPSSWWDPKLVRKRSSPSTMRCINSGDYQGSPPREPELVEEVVSSFEDCQGQKWREAPQMTAKPKSTDVWPPRSRTPGSGQERCLCREKPCQGKGGPSEGLGHGSSPRGGNRATELPPCQESARSMGMF